jgi:hypothetical protein
MTPHKRHYTTCVSLELRRVQTGYCFVDSDRNITGNAIMCIVGNNVKTVTHVTNFYIRNVTVKLHALKKYGADIILGAVAKL